MTMATTRKNDHLKINMFAVVTISRLSHLFAFYIVGEVRFKWTGVRAAELNTES